MQSPITVIAGLSKSRFRRWTFLPLGVLALIVIALTLFGGGGNPASAQQFSTSFTSGNGDQKWISSDGTTMYVSDSGADKVFAYNRSDMSHDSGNDIPHRREHVNDRDNLLGRRYR